MYETNPRSCKAMMSGQGQTCQLNKGTTRSAEIKTKWEEIFPESHL